MQKKVKKKVLLVTIVRNLGDQLERLKLYRYFSTSKPLLIPTHAVDPSPLFILDKQRLVSFHGESGC